MMDINGLQPMLHTTPALVAPWESKAWTLMLGACLGSGLLPHTPGKAGEVQLGQRLSRHAALDPSVLWRLEELVRV